LVALLWNRCSWTSCGCNLAPMVRWILTWAPRSTRVVKFSGIIKDKIPRQIYREIKNLKGLLMLSYIFLVLLFLLPFLTWPGFGSTIFWSPLDMFLLENYPLWFIAFYSFVLGIAVEVPSAWLFARLYMTKISPHLLKEENKSRKISFMQFSLGIISCLPLIIMFLYFVVLDFNPLSLTLIYLAQLKGSSEKYYYGYLDMAVTSWFTSGILFTLFVASFYLRNLFLKKLEERGVEVRELKFERVNLKEGLASLSFLSLLRWVQRASA